MAEREMAERAPERAVPERDAPERDAEREAERRPERALNREAAEVVDVFFFAFFLEIDFDLAGNKSYPLS
jgi:hypothetical protein